MKLIDAHLQARDSDRPLVLDVPPDSGAAGRLVAEVYALADGGIATADIGWSAPDNPTHPFHVFPAPDEGPQVYEPTDGSYAIRPVVSEVEPELVDAWNRWREIREEQGATRERGREAVEELIGPTAADD